MATKQKTQKAVPIGIEQWGEKDVTGMAPGLTVELPGGGKLKVNELADPLAKAKKKASK